MKLEQLRYLCALVNEDMNMTRAAAVLNASQPGVSKQIKLLEEELELDLLKRGRHRISGLTPAGVQVVEIARRILADAQRIKSFGKEAADGRRKRLTIATTHLHANYVFPSIVAEFYQKFPDVELILRNGEPKDIFDDVMSGKADLGVTTTSPDIDCHLLRIPGYEFGRSLIMPKGHPLSKKTTFSLEDCVHYPLITYCFNFAGSTAIINAFEMQGLQPTIAIRTMDTESIKKYVRLGLGISVLNSVAVDATSDPSLTVVDVTHLFGKAKVSVIIRPSLRRPEHFWNFIERLAPTWNRQKIAAAIHGLQDKAAST